MASDIHAHGDILIGNLPLNSIDEDGCRWIVSDVEGWWGTPPGIIPEDERPYNEDGNYWTAGRYGARTIQIMGVIVPPRVSEASMKKIMSRAREKLLKEINLVRRKGRLTFHEVDASKSIDVQLMGQPLINTSSQDNVLHFDIQFVAQDPRKHSTSPQIASATLMNSNIGGRAYPKTYGLKYGTSSGTSKAHAINVGDTPTHSVIRITGPIIDPVVNHQESGSYLKVNLTLGANDFLDVDLLKKNVVLNGTESRLANLDFDSSWFVLQPGDNTLSFGGVQTAVPQEGWPAATNLVTNPSAERAGSSQVIHSNLLPDPAISEVPTIPTVTRRNIAENPGFEPGFTQEFENLVTNPRGRNTSGTVVVRENLVNLGSAQSSSGSSISVSGSGIEMLANGSTNVVDTRFGRFPVESGTPFSISLDILPLVSANTPKFDVRLNFNNAGGNTVGSPSLPVDTLAVGESYHRIDEFVVPATAVDVAVWIRSVGDNVAGDKTLFSNILFEKGLAGEHFDGDTSPDPDLTPEWTGTPGASTSRLVGPRPVGWQHVDEAGAYYSASRDAIAMANETYLTGPTGHSEDCTVLMWAETDDGSSADLSCYRNAATPGHTEYFSTPSGGTKYSHHTSGGAGAYVWRWESTSGGRQTVYFRAAVVPGNYTGPFFDGHSENVDPSEHSWAGTADNSVSIRKTRTISGAVAGPGAVALSSKGWSSSGDYSLKISPTGFSEDTYADITPSDIMSLRGRYCTISGNVHVEGLDFEEDEAHPNLHSLVLRYVTEEEITDIRSRAIGDGRVALTARIPETASSVRILAYNGRGLPDEVSDETDPDNLSVYWDDILISAGGVDPSFFTASSTAPGTTYMEVDGGVNEIKAVTPNWSADQDSAAYSGKVFDAGLNIEFFGSSAVSFAPPAGLDTPVEVLTVGATVAAGDRPILASVTLLSESEGGFGLTAGEVIPVLANQEVYISAVLPKPDEPYRIGVRLNHQVSEDEPQTASRARIVNALVSDGAYSGPYFDGDTPIADMSSAWVSGTSVARAVQVPGYTPSDNALVYQSGSWASSGSNSLAVLRKDTDTEGESTYAEITSPVWSSLPSGQYTLIATVSAEDGEYLEATNTRALEVIDESSGQTFLSEQAPVGVPTRLTLPFEKTGPGGSIRLVSNALGPVTVRWDGIMIVSGPYSDRYFDGSISEASWNGTAHNSTSSQNAKQKIQGATLSAEFHHTWIR